ncbi:MAG TPA: dodecin family protein, partial [Fimbriimonadaceae bacterium]|nr:dodecin family protein [Fimbriimonadaceae bacterium]
QLRGEGRTLIGESLIKGATMPVARVTELSAISDQSFEDAINQAINRATSTLRNVEAAHVKDMNVMIENGNITGYKANLEIVFVLEDDQSPA